MKDGLKNILLIILVVIFCILTTNQSYAQLSEELGEEIFCEDDSSGIFEESDDDPDSYDRGSNTPSGNNDEFCPNGVPDINAINKHISETCPHLNELINKPGVPEIQFVNELPGNFCGFTRCPVQATNYPGVIKIRVCNRNITGAKNCPDIFCGICGTLAHELGHLLYCKAGGPPGCNLCHQLAIEISVQYRAWLNCLQNHSDCENAKNWLLCYCKKFENGSFNHLPCYRHVTRGVLSDIERMCRLEVPAGLPTYNANSN